MDENLQLRLNELVDSLLLDPLNIGVVASRVSAVLDFLNQPCNNTGENCEAINWFILLRILDDAAASRGLARLPRALRGIIEDMGMCLHDAHSAPEIAIAFESLPEQLLARIQRFNDVQSRIGSPESSE